MIMLLLAAAAAPQISSERIDSNRFRLSISGGTAGIAAAQAALLPTARRLCGERAAAFGTFRIDQSVEQEVLCGSGRASLDPRAATDASWKPTDLDQQAVLAATYAYFSAKDSARYSDAWRSLSDRMKRMSPVAPWQAKAAEFNRNAGPVRARRVTELTWYNNPPDAPEPGIYVAADYSADFGRLEFLCGYVMWLLQPDGSFRLVREEQNMLDKETARKVPSLDRAPLKAQMGCKA
jgi:hypothetical protein